MKEEKSVILACSDCFNDEGLKLDAEKIGVKNETTCPNCKNDTGKKLDSIKLSELAFRFFVKGTTFKTDFGGANAVEFNDFHYGKDEINVPVWLQTDLKLIAALLGIGFFYYGPSMWRVGLVEPLEQLQAKDQRSELIQKILGEYPVQILSTGLSFYRLRKNPEVPEIANEYDSPPDAYLGRGRLDSENFPVLYGSQDVEVCIHECRVSVEDELFLATLTLSKDIKVLDLTAWINEEDKTPFNSLNNAIQMLFGASMHSYEIIRDIAKAAKEVGLHGLIYPSYFSQIHAKTGVIGNIGLFGRPIKDSVVTVKCIDRLIVNTVKYDYHFGPAKF